MISRRFRLTYNIKGGPQRIRESIILLLSHIYDEFVFSSTGAHAEALGREAVRVHVAGLLLAFLPVRRTVPTLSVAFRHQAVRLRRVRKTVFAVRPPDQALARPPQANGRSGRPVAVAAATVSAANRRETDRGLRRRRHHRLAAGRRYSSVTTRPPSDAVAPTPTP